MIIITFILTMESAVLLI